jgi:hypothetical protein
VFVFGSDWSALADFFADLATLWQGWEGERSWTSVENDLTLTAVWDALGHVELGVIVRDGPAPTWTARVDDIVVDAGEDMSTIARTVAEWSRGP